MAKSQSCLLILPFTSPDNTKTLPISVPLFLCHRGKKTCLNPELSFFLWCNINSIVCVENLAQWMSKEYFCFKIAVGRNVLNCSVVIFWCQKIGNVGLNTCDFCLKICFYVDHVIMGERNVVTC